MKIKKLQIKNFKSLVDFELEDLKPFCAFVGPNASGKSNIFEALEFTNYLIKYAQQAPGFFGGKQNIYSYFPRPIDKTQVAGLVPQMAFSYLFDDGIGINFSGSFAESEDRLASFGSWAVGRSGARGFSASEIRNVEIRKKFVQDWQDSGNNYENDYEQFADNFSRIFVGKSEIKRTPDSSIRLSPDASNLSQIIGLIFQDVNKRNDFVEWLRILIPEFRDIEVKSSNIDRRYEFFIYEKSSSKAFPRSLISDGTYNILSMMAGVYQSNEPQFLCIEEPENGLHPQAIELIVDFFREKCEEEGHHIWLNTHSQTLVRCLEIDEIILVNKIEGATHAKQLRKEDEVNIKTDEAWLSNALGGGVL